ncbi:short-chain dehydrogenase like protein [Zymoseptoria brevis]|uniref:Short-chain dehydrogenase like protein n=1 Tax=Zymoseptoria brevis TaxID=1047168 RepID=A0A0F4G4H7_9PEZI|nr:short-chain dehydrogenase like protein [Zymoseptoria brevis]
MSSNPSDGECHPTLHNLLRLDNRTIIVTGGLGSLGTCLSSALLHHGADVIIFDLPLEADPKHLEQIRQEASNPPSNLHYIHCNAISEASVTSAFTTASSLARHPIRGLITCAGISGNCPAVDYPITDFRRIIDINVTGSFLCARAAAQIMHRQQSSGSIVMVASMSGTNVNRGVDTTPYNASKSAVLQLARNLAAEWGNDGIHPPIRVNTLSPGYILTPMTVPTFEERPGLKTLWPDGNMLGRMSNVEEYRSAVVFLLSDGNSYMTGSDLRIDAGHCAW